MRYVVHGYRTEVISVEIEAGSAQEAMDLATDGTRRDIDVWDTNFEWHVAYEQD